MEMKAKKNVKRKKKHSRGLRVKTWLIELTKIKNFKK
jgi:hypothetical protein